MGCCCGQAVWPFFMWVQILSIQSPSFVLHLQLFFFNCFVFCFLFLFDYSLHVEDGWVLLYLCLALIVNVFIKWVNEWMRVKFSISIRIYRVLFSPPFSKEYIKKGYVLRAKIYLKFSLFLILSVCSSVRAWMHAVMMGCLVF